MPEMGVNLMEIVQFYDPHPEAPLPIRELVHGKNTLQEAFRRINAIGGGKTKIDWGSNSIILKMVTNREITVIWFRRLGK